MSAITNFKYDPNGKYLFKRAYALTIGQVGQTAALQYANFQIAGANGQVQPPSPLRVRFDIQKNTLGSPNKSKIEIFNLSQQSRQAIKIGYVLQLQAGYSGLMDVLFVGNVSPTGGVKSTRTEADIITAIECLDGGSAITVTTLDKSYPAGTTLAQIIADIAAVMRTPTASNPLGAGAGVAVGIPDVTYARGRTIHGSCRNILDELLKPQGLRWSVQNGNLTIVPANAYNGSSAILISSNTGMIGVPSDNGQYTEFVSLLNPKLVPEAIVQLVSENTSLNGFYKVLNCHYEGDTHDNKWQVTCQCTKMPKGTIQTLAVSTALNPTSTT